MSKWLDISVSVKTGMVHWPSDPPVKITKSSLSMGLHTGTHLDAPLHFIKTGKGIDKIPLEVLVGTARVIEIKDARLINPQELKKQHIRSGDRLLFKTRNSATLWKRTAFSKDYVHMTSDSARYCAAQGVKLIGIDYLSVGGYHDDGDETHRVLLKAGILIIEGLDLSKVKAGTYEYICLPLKILNADGAPARVLIRFA
jgi:arylformamidase